MAETASWRRWLPWFAALCAPAIFPCAALAGVATIPLSAYGLGAGVTVTGSNPHFDLYVPDYPQARRIEARFDLQFSPIVDDDTSIVVRVNGAPVATTNVRAVRDGKQPVGSFTHLKGKGALLDVSVEASLRVGGKPCQEYDPHQLWMRVLPGTAIAVDENGGPPANVAQFFQDYGGQFAVDLAPNATDADRTSAVSLAYWLHQVERWRRVRTSFLVPPAAGARKIVVGSAPTDLGVRNGVLYLTRTGIDLLLVKGAPRVVVAPSDGVAKIQGLSRTSPQTLDDLGIGTRTQRGAGDLEFPISFTLGTFGGLPRDLHANLEIAHAGYDKEDRARAIVLLNGAAVNGFPLSSRGGTERFDVPIDDRRLGPSNQLTVLVEFLPHGCDRSTLAVSLLGSSSLRWNGVAGYPPTIGEFVSESTGHLGVAIAGAELDPYAFTLLDRLGAVDPNVTRLTVSRYAGSSLEGVKEAIYVTPPGRLAALPISWDPSTGDLRLSNDEGKTTFNAQTGLAYGLVRAFSAGIPSLLLTYTKTDAAQVLNGLDRVTARDLGSARSDVLLFDATGIVFQGSAHSVIGKRTPPSPLRTSWPLIVLFLIVVAVALVIIARRARKVS